MELMDLFLTSLGASVVVYCGLKLIRFSQVLFPNIWFPLSQTFFTSMGEWAVVTGASEGIGRAYALALAEQGMNVVIMSRTKAKLDQVAKEIGDKTGQKVKVIVTDFIQEYIFDEIEAQLKDLDIGVLVNNVGVLPSMIPHRFLDCPDVDQTIANVINCNVKTMAKMCKIILPGMENRRKGLILNISSGVVCVPFPLYSLYAASKVFVHKLSQGLHLEYKDKGIIIQSVAPFGVSTRMTGYQATNLVTLSPEHFVKSSLEYVRAGDNTYGSVSHTLLSWILQTIPSKLLDVESIQQMAQDYIENRLSNSASNTSTDNGRK
ncbi:17-beta-hydroxysteroid dehydrogenase type 3 isoform X2 [Echeneis naucrates]|uniref:Hydroxysteroid (17-beta) dehydrogenase 3 n=1 Tax=Echeneis naucrates TaxID=173247 RepID=A0A665X671_ECHNA|nr:testosterone 17-beta-dehydrogenase 3 isoform X2 [Echeneis naucrates]